MKDKANKFRIIAEFLASCREHAGLTQSEVSDALGYTSPQFVSNWERGLAKPPIEILGRLMKLYKMKPEAAVEIILAQQRVYIEEKLNMRPSRAKNTVKPKAKKSEKIKEIEI